jgi:hypothetical protein
LRKEDLTQILSPQITASGESPVADAIKLFQTTVLREKPGRKAGKAQSIRPGSFAEGPVSSLEMCEMGSTPTKRREFTGRKLNER